MKLLHKIALGVLGLSTVASAADINLYGFMDMTMNKTFTETPTIMHYYGFDEGYSGTMGNVNLYIDANINQNLRSLVEINFNVDPYANAQSGAMVTNVSIPEEYGGIQVQPNDTSYSGDSRVETRVENFTSVKRSNWVGVGLERAWMDYLLKDVFNVRAGKFLTPYGIWNVDHGSPIIIPVQQPYEVSLTKIFPTSQTGLMGYGTAFLGDYDLSYKVYASAPKENPVYDYNGTVKEVKDLAGGGNVSLALPFLDELKVGTSIYSGSETKSTNYATTNVVVDPTTGAPISITLGENSQVYSRHYKLLDFGFDLRASMFNVIIQGEYNQQNRKNYLAKDSNGDYYTSGVKAGYALLAYKARVNDKFYIMPYGMFESIVADHGETPGMSDGPVEVFLDGYNVYTGGLNFGLFSNSHIKIEYNYGQVKPSNNGTSPLTVTDDQMLTRTVKTQFSVAF